MILVKWFNVYLTEDSFVLGEGFEREFEAAANKNEHPHFHETTCIPTEVKVDEVLHS